MTITEAEVLAVDVEDTTVSATSWGAIIAGAMGAVAASLVLMLVGSGMGLTLASPWSATGTSVATFAVSGMIWLVVVQWLSSALGGYLAGRLLTRWTGVHSDEVFFRDTAHGFVTWALSTIIVAVLLTSAVGTIIAGTASKATDLAASAMQGAAQSAGQKETAAIADPMAYFVDTLFRRPAQTAGAAAPSVSPTGNGQAVRDEAARILVAGAASGEVADADKAYLAQLIANETGISAEESQARVNDVLSRIQSAKEKAKEAADKARKAGATVAILTALSLAIGAFIASVAAALGGRLRDAPR